MKPLRFALITCTLAPVLSAAELTIGYTIGGSQLSPNGETLFVDNAAVGGGDAQSTSGNLPWVAEIQDLWSPTDEVTVSGLAFALPGGFTESGTMTFTFYGLGANNTFDGAANETLLGSATGTLAFNGTAGAYYVNFDTPIAFTAGSTGIAVHIRNSAPLRVKVNTAAVAPGVVRRNLTTGALSGGEHPNFRMSLAGTAVVSPKFIWHGGLGNQWNTTTLNWNGGTRAYSDGIRTIFDDTAVSTSPAMIELTAARAPLVVEVNNQTLDYVFSGSAIAGPASLIKQGSGFLTLAAANSYAGGTALSDGRLIVGNDSALGTGTLTLAGGTFHALGTGARQFANPVTITDATTLGDVTANGGLTFAGDIDFASASRDLAIFSNVTFSGSPSNGGLRTKTGPGTLTFTGTGTQTAGNWQIGRGDIVLNGANIDRPAGGVRIACQIPGETSRLVLTNGAVLTTVSGSNIRVGSDSDFIGNNTANNILDVSGTGTQLHVGGSVSVGPASAVATVNLTNGAFLQTVRISGIGSGFKVLNIGNATLAANTSTATFLQGLNEANLLAGGATFDTSGFNVTAAQNLGGSGALTKIGAGILTLAGNNAYAGVTTVTAGGLRIDGDQTFATGAVQVATGAAFGGTGIVGGNVVFQGGATALFAKTQAAVDSPLRIPGSLTLSNTAVSVDVPGAAALGNGTHLIAIVDGTLTGTFQAVPQITGAGLQPGGTATIQVTGNDVNLVVTGGVADPYEAWAGPAGFNLSGGKFDDDDNNGVPNYLEFALAGDPTDPSDRGLLAYLIQDATAPAGDEFTLIAAVRRGAVFGPGFAGSQSAVIDGINYTIEGTADLTTFNAAVTHAGAADTAPPATGLPSLVGSAWEYHTFSLDASEGLTSAGFLRLAITTAP